MKKSEPKISIIIPVYNTEKYLAQCLDSVINQTYSNIQILCVNDGSTDRSREIVNKYSKLDGRIVCLDKENGGLSSARNYAHTYVEGDYIMYLDSDDWLETDTCEIAVYQAVEQNADVVCWNYIREIGDTSRPKIIMGNEKIVFLKKEVESKLHRRFLGLYKEELRCPENANSFDTAWGKLYRASIILDNNIEYVDTKQIGTEDALFNLYVFGYVRSAVYIPDCLNHYRRDNGTSLTKTYKRSLKKQWDNLHGYMAEYIAKEGLDSTYTEALNNRICLSIIGLGMNVLRAGDEVNRLREIKTIINSPTYKKACQSLELRYFPIHWKVFFWLAKHQCVLGIYFMLECIRKMKGN